MSEASTLQTQTTQAPPSNSHSLLVQRKCACGGSSGLTGSCSECEKKNLLGKPLQTKLRVNEPGDEYEREAEHVAEQVMRMSEVQIGRETSPPPTAPLVQRRVNGMSAVGSDAAPPIVHDVLATSGQPLDAATRAFFEPRFGHDFGNVRVHADAKAAESAQVVKASAYTTGSDIVFGTGQYMPKATEGNRLLTHELAHVVQQSGALTHTQVSAVSNPASIGSADRLNAGVSTNALTNTEGPVLQRQGFYENLQSGVAGVFESGFEFLEDSADAAARAALSVLGTPDPSTIMGLIERALHMPGVGEAILSHSAVAPHRKQIEQLLVSHGAFEVVGNFIQNPKAHVDQISRRLVPYIAEGQRVAIENGNDLLAQFEIPPEYRERVLQVMVPLAGMAKTAFDFVIEEIILDTVLFWQLRSENQIYDAAWENYEKGTIDAFDLIIEHIDIVLNVLGRVADLTPLVLAGAGIVAGGAAGGTAGSVVPGAGTAAGSGGGGGVGGGTGLAVSEVVGLVLVIAPAVVEGIRGSKAGLEFALKDQNDAQRQQDSGQIAASIIGLAIMAALAFAPGLALRLGKAIGRKLRQFIPDVISKLVSVSSSALETATSRRAAALEASSGIPNAAGSTSGKDVPRSKGEAPQREEITSPTSGTELEDSVKQSSKRENDELTETEKINEVAWVDAHPEVVSGSPGQKKATLGDHEIVSVPGVGCQRHSNDTIDIPCPLPLIVSDSGSPEPVAALPLQAPHFVEPRRDFAWAQPPAIPTLDLLPRGTGLSPIPGSRQTPGVVSGPIPTRPRPPAPARTTTPQIPENLNEFRTRIERELEAVPETITALSNAYDELGEVLAEISGPITFRGRTFDGPHIAQMARDILEELNNPKKIAEAVTQIEQRRRGPAGPSDDAAGSFRQAVLALADEQNIPVIVLQPSETGNVVTLEKGNIAALGHTGVPIEGRKFATGEVSTDAALQSAYLFEPSSFMQHVVGSEAWFIDESALGLRSPLGEPQDHGAITHIIQDVVVDNMDNMLFRRYGMSAIEFRALLSSMGELGSKIWLRTYDIPTPPPYPLSRPETMWSIIREALGIRRGDL